jgi:hypothetical protein
MIGPVLHTMRQRFSVSVADFAFFAEHSPLVPRECVDLFAKGRHASYCLDFVQATHLLQPQFEYLVRMQLKAAGALTSPTSTASTWKSVCPRWSTGRRRSLYTART